MFSLFFFRFILIIRTFLPSLFNLVLTKVISPFKPFKCLSRTEISFYVFNCFDTVDPLLLGILFVNLVTFVLNSIVLLNELSSTILPVLSLRIIGGPFLLMIFMVFLLDTELDPRLIFEIESYVPFIVLAIAWIFFRDSPFIFCV